MFSIQQNCRREKNRFCLEVKGVGGGEGGRGLGVQIVKIMYADMNI
jgi:hypothetical protein